MYQTDSVFLKSLYLSFGGTNFGNIFLELIIDD